MTMLDAARPFRATVLAVAVLVGLAGCSAGPPTPTGSTPSRAASPAWTSAATEAPLESAAPNTDIDALAALDCDGEPSSVGGAPPLEVEAGGESATGALAALMALGFAVPKSGYVQDAADLDEELYVYRADGKVKSAVVVKSQRSDARVPWVADELRACDWTEFGADADLGPGYEAWVQPDGRVLWAAAGPEHCGMESATFLTIGKRQYIQDPQNVIAAQDLVKPYEADAMLPDDAIDTTYRKGARELWAVPDKSAVFNVGPNKTELWPRSKDTITCM
jgi:hypothetical protein